MEEEAGLGALEEAATMLAVLDLPTTFLTKGSSPYCGMRKKKPGVSPEAGLPRRERKRVYPTRFPPFPVARTGIRLALSPPLPGRWSQNSRD